MIRIGVSIWCGSKQENDSAGALTQANMSGGGVLLGDLGMRPLRRVAVGKPKRRSKRMEMILRP